MKLSFRIGALFAFSTVLFFSCNNSLSVEDSESLISFTDETGLACRMDYNLKTLSVNPPADLLSEEAVFGSSFDDFVKTDSVQKIVLGKGITSIRAKAFSQFSNLETVKIGSSVISVDDEAFSDTSASFDFSSADVSQWGREWLKNFNAPVTWTIYPDQNGSKVLWIFGNGDMNDYLLKNSSVVKTKSFSTAPWSNSEFNKIIIENTVTRIGNNAFAGGEVKEIESVELSENLVSAGYSAFASVSCPEIFLPQSLILIENNSFSALKRKESKIQLMWASDDQTVRELYGIETNCEADIFFDDGVKYTGLFSWEIKDEVLSISGEGVFPYYSETFPEWQEVKKILIGKGVTVIPANSLTALSECKMICIPASVTEIEENAFVNWTYDQTIQLDWDSSDLTERNIQPGAFWGGRVLYNDKKEFVRSKKTDEGFEWKITEGKIIFSGEGKVPFYSIDEHDWRGIENIEIQKGITGFEKNFNKTAFSNYESSNSRQIKQITLPEDMLEISDYAFYACCQLKEITVPETVVYIGSNAFGIWGEDQIITLDWNKDDETERQISPNAFGNATVVYKDGQTYSSPLNNFNWSVKDDVLTISGQGEISFYAENFPQWKKVKSVIISEGVTFINKEESCYSAFSNYGEKNACHIQSVTLPSTLQNIPAFCFYGCEKLSEITIPESVKSIGKKAFALTAIKE